MAKTSNLKRLMDEEIRAYKREQNAYEKYQIACEKEHELYEQVASTWGEYKKAEKDFKATFNEKSLGIPSSDEPWQKYLCTKARNTPAMARLRKKAENEEEERINLLRQVEILKKGEDKDEIGGLRLEAKDHEDNRKNLYAEIKELGDEIREAKEIAKKSESYIKKKKQVDDAMAHHQSAKWEHSNAKHERNRLRFLHEKAKLEHEEAMKNLKEEKARIAEK